jgi:hypothetical protein
MAFKISPKELLELARLEEEAGCNVEAGFDWGAEVRDYLRQSQGVTATPLEGQGENKE